MEYYVIAICFTVCLVQLPLLATANDLATCRKACQNAGIVFKSVPKPGPQGPPGPPGKPASVSDHLKLKLEVDAKMAILSDLWQMTTNEMQNTYNEKVLRLEKALGEIQKELKNTREALCPLRYKKKCFWAVLQDDVTFKEGKKLCARMGGGRPANVYDEDHYNMVLKYMKALMPKSQKFLFLWIGMKVKTQTGSVTLVGGGSADFVQWRSNYPSTDYGYDSILLMARSDGNLRHEGMYNQSPEYGKPGVLCEA